MKFSRQTITFVLAAVAISIGASIAHGKSFHQIVHPSIFFDLGNVIIDTHDPDHYKYVEGAELYLRTLKQNGFQIGLISNIPETWGRTPAEKLATLKANVAKVWVEPRPFPWESFDLILLPPNDKLRKPHPYLFIQAMNNSTACQPVYQGDDGEELKTATTVGFGVYLVDGTDTPQHPKFAPIKNLICRPRIGSRFYRMR